jgi:hypothetical protein
VTPSAAAGEGKKTDEGTMIPLPEPNSKSDPVAVADPPEMRNQTPATTKEAFDILTNSRNWS